MIKTLSLYIALILAVAPAAAQVQEGAGAGAKIQTTAGASALGTGPSALVPTLPAASIAADGYLHPSVVPALQTLTLGLQDPAALKPLGRRVDPAAVYARLVLAGKPVAKVDRAVAVTELGENGVKAIEAAVAAIKKNAAGSEKASAALKQVAADFAALGEKTAEDAPVSASVSVAKKPVRLSPWNRVKKAVLTTAILATMAVSAPAVHAQTASPALPNPVVLMAQTGQQQQAVVLHATDINDAVARWTPATKLIIIGNPGLDDAAQRDLVRFLQDKHWTAIVSENASGMTFRDAEGNTRYGKEALEFGAGQGIFRKGGFSSQVDSASGLADGSILVISMQEHYLYLRNSEAQRVNGLDGAQHFAGDLDQYAKARLRAGGDISGAIKESVTNIDARLQSAVASAARNASSSVADAKSALSDLETERASFSSSHPGVAAIVGAADIATLRSQVTAAERALANKNPAEATRLASNVSSTANAAVSAMKNYETNYATGAGALKSARAEVDALEKTSSAFLSSHKDMTGDLARPDIRGLREQLKTAEASLSKNPAAAKSTADGVVSEVRRISAALTEWNAGAKGIADAKAVYESLQAKPLSGVAVNDLVTAKQELRSAEQSREAGSSQWAAHLQTAKNALANAERTIADADAAAARNAMIALWLKILGALATIVTLAGLNFFARRAKGKASAELQKWDDILQAKLDAIIDQLDTRMDTYVGPISGPKSRGWEDETAELAAQVRKDAGRAKLYLAMARNIHGRATALVRPKSFTFGWFVNQFWGSRYNEAVELLANKPLTFDPQDGFDVLYEKKGDWRSDIYGEAKDYEKVSENFSGVMEKFNTLSKSAIAALDEVEKASTGYGAAFDATEAAIGASEKKATEAAASSYFQVVALGTKVLPAAREQLTAARAKAAKNPVGAMKGQGALAERLSADAKSLAEYALTMYAAETKTVDPIVAALTAASVGTKWVADSRAALDERATKLAESLLKTPGEKGLESLHDAYAAHAADAARAKKILDAVKASQGAAATSAASVDSARATVAAQLNLAAKDMLRETDADPSQRLSAAADAFADSLAQLGRGALDAAEKAQLLGAQFVAQADAIVAASLKSLKDQAGDVDGRIAEAQRLDALQQERAVVLKSIQRDFAPSVLKLGSGDVSHPSANGTIDDNVDEAQTAIDSAKSKREKAVKSFREGRVLEAASLLSQAKAHEEIAQVRLDEIAEKRARLDKAVADNLANVEALEAKFRKWKTEIPDDSRTMRPTMKAYDAAGTELASARGLVDAKKGDPFQAAAALAAVSATLDHLWVMVSNDRDAYAEVVRSLKAADAQLDAAARLAKDAQGDGVADSPAISAAYRELANLRSAYQTAYSASQAAHGDWPAADHEADRITNEAAHVAATLKGELAAAARATEAISRAAAQVREATNWTGSYGVSVPGSPGSGSLSSARSALNNGDYDGAIRYAESARSAAISAIQEAEAEVSRRRRAEEERQRREAEERRRREQEEEDRRRRSSDSGGGSSGGGGSSWGSSSSGGGSSSW